MRCPRPSDRHQNVHTSPRAGRARARTPNAPPSHLRCASDERPASPQLVFQHDLVPRDEAQVRKSHLRSLSNEPWGVSWACNGGDILHAGGDACEISRHKGLGGKATGQAEAGAAPQQKQRLGGFRTVALGSSRCPSRSGPSRQRAPSRRWDHCGGPFPNSLQPATPIFSEVSSGRIAENRPRGVTTRHRDSSLFLGRRVSCSSHNFTKRAGVCLGW